MGLSQRDAAKLADITGAYLSNLENGHNEPSTWPLLARLAQALHCSADYLLGVVTDPTPTGDVLDLIGDPTALAILGALKKLPDEQRAGAIALLRRGDSGALLGLMADPAVIDILESLISLTSAQRATVANIIQQAQSLTAASVSDTAQVRDSAQVRIARPAGKSAKRPTVRPPAGKGGKDTNKEGKPDTPEQPQE